MQPVVKQKGPSRQEFMKNLGLEVAAQSEIDAGVVSVEESVEVKLFTIRPRKKLIFKGIIPGGLEEGEKFGREMAHILSKKFIPKVSRG